MLVKHVHDMYMSRHAFIVKKSCTCYVYVEQTCTCFELLDIQSVGCKIVPPCTCLREIQKNSFLERKDTETQRFILNNSKETKNAPCGALAFKKIIHDDQKI